MKQGHLIAFLLSLAIGFSIIVLTGNMSPSTSGAPTASIALNGDIISQQQSPRDTHDAFITGNNRMTVKTPTPNIISFDIRDVSGSAALQVDTGARTRTYIVDRARSRIAVPVPAGRTTLEMNLSCTGEQYCAAQLFNTTLLRSATGAVFGTGWYRSAATETYRWLRNNGSLYIHNDENREAARLLRLRLRSFNTSRNLTIKLNGAVIGRRTVSAYGQIHWFNATLQPGVNRLSLSTTASCTPFGAVNNNDDVRCGAVGLADITLVTLDHGLPTSTFGQQWYPRTGNEAYRWSPGNATMALYSSHSTPVTGILKIRGKSFNTPRNVTFRLNGERLGTKSVPTQFSSPKWYLFNATLRPGQNTVEIASPQSCTSFARVNQNDDTRCGMFGIRDISFVRNTDTFQQTLDTTPRTALIVLDGGEWRIVNRLMQEGRLPALQNMTTQGAYGTLITPRAFSPVSWTKLGTGQDATDLAVTGWNVQRRDGSPGLVQSTDVIQKRIWNYLNEAGIRTGVVQWLLTWPVEPVTGYMVSGPMARSDTELIHPATFFTSEEKATIRKGGEWEIANSILDNPKNQAPFLALGFKRLDALQHHLWKFVEPEKVGIEETEANERYRELVYREYERLDEVVSRFNESWNVIVVSDSGFEPEMWEYGYAAPTYEMNLNPLLKAIGYTQYRETVVRGQKITQVEPGSPVRWCPVIYPRNNVINETTYRLRICVEDQTADVSTIISQLEQVDYRDGRNFLYNLSYNPATRSIHGNVHLYRDGFVQEKVVDGYVNQPTVTGSSYYVDVAVGLELPGGEPFKFWIGPEKSGDHPPGTNGIFLASGPAIQERGQLPNGTIRAVDIAPTILYMYGLPVPASMDGTVVHQLFTDEFRAQRPLQRIEMDTQRTTPTPRSGDRETEAALKQRLRELGYFVQ